MNKKRLSVVMAGAMLATSVAPVLAAETTGTEIAYNQKETFKADILAKMAEKKISDFAIFKKEGFVSKDIADELAANTANEFSSAYGIKVIKKDGTKEDTVYRTAQVKAAIDALEAEDKVEVYERQTVEFLGQLIPGEAEPSKTSSPVKYTTGSGNDFDAAKISDTRKEIFACESSDESNNKLVKNVSADSNKEVLTVTLDKITNINNDTNETLELTKDNNKIDGRLALDKDGKLIDIAKDSDTQKFHSFGDLVNWKPASEAKDKGAKLESSYVMGEKPADETKETVKVADLYDGIALTARGTEILADIENAREAAKNAGIADAQLNNKATVRISSVDDTKMSSLGIVTFKVTYYSNANIDKVEKEVTIVSNSTTKDEAEALHKLLDSGDFKVGIVAGQNRYETAINVSKQIGLTALNATSKNNIVLVNGESLVDGLAAAPLAAELGCYQKGGTKLSAPLLLTEAGSLPTATREYLEELSKDLTTPQKKTVKIHLVGGTTVLNSDLASELKGMGFTVVRHGGDNREETSVAVAEAMATKSTKAFVVGANGEADAMSISAVASKTGSITPIIVAKAGGISVDALNYLTEVAADDVTIIGGEKAVSAEEEKEINGALNGAVAMRIAGANRFETNEAIINTYYKGKNATAVVTVKDGSANNKELIDALSAANYAASKLNGAPIVLASKSVTNGQKTALLGINVTPTNVDKVVQVGMGAEQSVLRTIAGLFDAKN